MSEMKEYFDSNGYIYLENVLDAETCEILVDEIFKTYNAEDNHHYDDQSPKSEAFSDLPFFKIIHNQLKPVFEQASGRTLVPTYTYARIYRKGDELPIHIDRKDCEISATITLGLSDDNIWPIGFSKKSDKSDGVYVKIPIGSAIVYKGMEMYHWRNALEDDWQVQIFLHYVDANGKHVSKEDEDEKWYFGQRKEKKYLYTTFDNFLNQTFIDKIIEYAKDKTEIAEVGDETRSSVVKKVRTAMTTSLPIEDFKWLYMLLEDLIMKTNHQNYKYTLDYLETLTYIEYYGTDKGHYDWHLDGMINSSRKLSFSILLSDTNEFEGGQLILNDGLEWKVEMKKGRVVFFPANVMHKVEPVTSGVRRVLVGWINGPHFS